MTEKRKVATKDGDIFYWVGESFAGRPTVVLLHGLSSNHTTWEPMVESLREKKVNTIALDQRGHGLSAMRRRSSLYRTSVFADDLEAVLKKEGVSRAVFVGYSYGGPVVLEYAHRHPEAVQGLAVISANHVSPARYMRLGFLSPLLWAILQILGYLLVWQRRKSYHYYQHGEASGYWQSTFRGLKTMPLSINLWMLSQVFVTDLSKALPDITAPTLIVRAAHDPFFSEAEARDMVARLPHATLMVPKHESHFVASQAQDEITDMVLSLAV